MWVKDTSPAERRVLGAAFAGYGVDAFDYMVYTFLIPTLVVVWGLTKVEAGNIATAALVTSAIGGWAAGVLADRYGRVVVLQGTVAWFTLFTVLSGFTQSYEQLLVTRALQGFGFGGEWSVGSVLIAETIQARYRGKAVGLVQSSWAVGWACAAIAFWAVFALAEPAVAWRILFWLGALPSVLIFWIRRNIEDPEVYRQTRAAMRDVGDTGSFLDIFSRPLIGRTVLASLLATGMQGGYYAVTTWLPTYLKTERNLSVLNTSGYLLMLIFGSFVGYLTSAWLSDRIGRRLGFVLFGFCAGILVLAYTLIPITDPVMLVLGFPLGFFLSGVFSGMGAFLSELFPSRIRGSAQGFCYNFGRATGAICPALVGHLSGSLTLGIAIGVVAAGAYCLVIVAALLLPETAGRALDSCSKDPAEPEPVAAL
ncbi:Predicted arabinose efflux permease, MFS family [Methylobacterium sp. UNC378MF]|uniref:MFS transporter n=1 Tax=Methylobacterium sp. UNC378MF TaxID=1502748 RepID=UPI0008889180|nr:MFS transporter [Methylobacterium sp. UNC378MF]SDA22353.1 Predicted arabinose efflux permease, MFS family [Methylobacterium sp. UNC378MF]